MDKTDKLGCVSPVMIVMIIVLWITLIIYGFDLRLDGIDAKINSIENRIRVTSRAEKEGE